MTAWPPAVLADIARTPDLCISPLRADGETYRTPTRIWSVVVDGELYVRAYNGRTASWYTAAVAQRRGRIRVARHTLDVDFSPADAPLRDDIDAAYRAKYGRSAYLAPMITPRAQQATLRITPRPQEGLRRRAPA